MPACIPGRILLVDNSLEDTGPLVNTELKLGRVDPPVDINEPNHEILLKRVRANAGTTPCLAIILRLVEPAILADNRILCKVSIKEWLEHANILSHRRSVPVIAS